MGTGASTARMAASLCALILFALGMALWAGQPMFEGELRPALRLVAAATAAWATATIAGILGPQLVERAVLGLLAASMLGLTTGVGWVLLEAIL